MRWMWKRGGRQLGRRNGRRGRRIWKGRIRIKRRIKLGEDNVANITLWTEPNAPIAYAMVL